MYLSQSAACEVVVPQGSFLVPILFNCIMAPLPQILRSMGIGYHSYADDTQFRVTFSEDNSSIEKHSRSLQEDYQGILSYFFFHAGQPFESQPQ